MPTSRGERNSDWNQEESVWRTPGEETSEAERARTGAGLEGARLSWEVKVGH